MRRCTILIGLACALALVPAAAGERSAGGATAQAERLVAPADGRAYFGFTFRLFDTSEPLWGDSRSLDERMRDSIQNELAGKTPAFIKVWTPWQRPDQPGKPLVPFSAAQDDIAKVRRIVGERGLLHLDWNVTLSTGANEGITTRDIAKGKLDGYVRMYARDVKAYGQPVLMTLFNGEFNGSWWYGVSPKANPLLTTTHFVRAWRRVVDIFRAVGVGNVSWAWVVNSYPNDAGGQPGIDRNIGAYYPGDDYVDWVGADVYDVGAPDWLDDPYAFAVAHGKPVFIGEFGIRHEWSSLSPPQWRTWLEAIFDYFESHPAIKAISYFNFNNRAGATRVTWDPARSIYIDGGQVNYVPGVNDHDHRLLAGGPEIQALFARRISSARYLSAISTESLTTESVAATARLLAPTVRGRVATVRWSGNLAADAFDLELKRGAGAWRAGASGTRAVSHRVRGWRGQRVRVRLRARNVYGKPGPWAPELSIRFEAG